MVVLARSVLVGVMFVLLSAPPLLQRWAGGDTRAYILTTIALALIAGALVLPWRTAHQAESSEASGISTAPGARRLMTIAAALTGAGLLLLACQAWLRQILTIPIDPYRADMLVVVREGLRRVFHGLNPYTLYHVPWPAPLPYGPMLWGPMRFRCCCAPTFAC